MNQITLDLVQQEIRACTRCVAAGFIPAANPMFLGHAGQRLMVVGQAPGPRASAAGEPYRNATGKALQGWLSRADATALCAPNQVVLQLTGNAGAHDSLHY